jgi:hypothetical protein
MRPNPLPKARLNPAPKDGFRVTVMQIWPVLLVEASVNSLRFTRMRSPRFLSLKTVNERQVNHEFVGQQFVKLMSSLH